MALDDRVVQFDAAVDQLFRVASPLPVAVTHLGIEQGSVLGRIDLDVRAAQANQLFDLTARDVDDVGQVLVAAHAAAPAQLLDHHWPLEHELLALLVSEWNRPTSLFVETVERVDEVAEERVTPLLAVRDHVDAGL